MSIASPWKHVSRPLCSEVPTSFYCRRIQNRHRQFRSTSTVQIDIDSSNRHRQFKSTSTVQFDIDNSNRNRHRRQYLTHVRIAFQKQLDSIRHNLCDLGHHALRTNQGILQIQYGPKFLVYFVRPGQNKSFS